MNRHSMMQRPRLHPNAAWRTSVNWAMLLANTPFSVHKVQYLWNNWSEALLQAFLDHLEGNQLRLQFLSIIGSIPDLPQDMLSVVNKAYDHLVGVELSWAAEQAIAAAQGKSVKRPIGGERPPFP